MPVETLVHYNQASYYKALQDSHNNSVDCRPFIDFMLNAIENSLYKYVDIATETVADVGVNVGVKVGVNVGVIFDMIEKLKKQPALTAQELAAMLNRSPRTIERHIKELRERGMLVRAGSDKSGYWQIIEM
jgi:Fic family protein